MKLGVLTVCAALVLSAGAASAMGQPPSHYNEFQSGGSSNPFRPAPANRVAPTAFMDDAATQWHKPTAPVRSRGNWVHHEAPQTLTGGPSGGIW